MAWEWISLLGNLPELITSLNAKARTNNATKKLLMRELRNNLKHYKTAKRNDLDYCQLIAALSNNEIDSALRNGFVFAKIKRGIITRDLVSDKRNRKYVGKNCELYN